MLASRTAFVFPGQGSQRLGMLDSLPEHDAFPRLLDAAEALADLDLRKIATAGPESDLADTRSAQPLLYLADWCWGDALMDAGVVPSLLAGHSLGELAALAVAGVFSVEAGLELVVERSKLMATCALTAPGTMAAVLGLQRDAIEQAVRGIDGVWVANDNSQGQVVVSGTHEGVGAATEALADAGARKVVPLNVAGAFHSPLMEPARAAFEDLIRGADFRDASIPVVQNTHPTPATSAEVIRERLVAQIAAPVRWTETMATLTAEGPVTIIEAGPGSVLTGLARKVPDATALAVESSGFEHILKEVS